MSILWLDEQAGQNAQVCGNKAAILSRLSARYAVPLGFCIAAHTGAAEIIQAYEILSKKLCAKDVSVAVRSSATDEDGQGSSFAGLYASYLNVMGAKHLLEAVESCLASAASERVAAYRKKFAPAAQSHIAVLVQQFIPAACAAVVFSANPVNGKPDEIIINAHWGLGESIVAGRVMPDTYVFSKVENRITTQQIGAKSSLMRPNQGNGMVETLTPPAMATALVLSEAQIFAAAQLALELEHQCGYPVDVECAWYNEKLYLLQCRPITT